MRVLGWFTCRPALDEARLALPIQGSPIDELGRRARLACELGDRLFDPIDPLREGRPVPVMLDLYRQSAYWALCALTQRGTVAPASEVWGSAMHAHLQALVADPEARESLRKLVVDASFIELGELEEAAARKLLLDAHTLAHDLLELLEGPARLVNRLSFRRFVRIGLALLVSGTLIAAAIANEQRRRLGPDLAAGKPWHASSVWAVCDPRLHRCGGLRTEIFFHTREDASPWVEFDLGSRLRFSKVFVKNRDEVPDRAIPLVIEVSNDQKSYHRVARRTDSFRTWTAELRPQTARYVRLRVDRKSYLHLEQVKIYK
jgi:hypothetical protein